MITRKQNAEIRPLNGKAYRIIATKLENDFYRIDCDLPQEPECPFRGVRVMPLFGVWFLSNAPYGRRYKSNTHNRIWRTLAEVEEFAVKFAIEQGYIEQ